MSSRKRSRTVEDDGNLSVEVESASSRFRSETHKRSRTVLAAEHGGSTFSDDDDDASGVDRLETASRFSSVAPDDLEYNSDEDDLAGMEAVATRYIQKHLQQAKENTPQSNGVIEEVLCTNFMCHAKLRITLGPLINFICGHNGSGKSAILTALTICLGSKASSTNRGANIRDMIKEGQDAAVVQVKIKNQGEGSYRYDHYGRSIIVERHISRTTAPSFKLKSADGKIVSTKKRDLDDILDHFSLQLDNPINVLNQDNARQFLANSTAGDKYKFYIKGTLLEHLDNDYRLIEASVDLIASKLHSMDDDIAVLRSEAGEAKQRWQRIRQNDLIRTKVAETRRMHAWAQVEEQERILQDRIEDVVRAQDKVREAETAAETASGVYEGRNQGREQSHRFMIEMEQELEPLKADFETGQAEFEAGRTKLTQLHSDLRNAKQDYRSAQARAQELRTKIDAETRLLAEAEGNNQVEQLNRLQELESQADQAREAREQVEASRMELEIKCKEAEQAVTAIQGRVEDRKTSAEQAQMSLERLQQAQGRRYAAFPPRTEQFVQAIETTTGWRSKPVGPLGQFVQLKQQHQHWAGLVEKTLGGILANFVVTCREDQVKLRQLQNRMNYHCTVVITTPAHLDVAGKEPDPSVDTILRILNITNEMVRNVLIIQASIEQIVLVEDRAKTMRYMYGNQRPAKTKAALTFARSRGGDGVRFGFSRSGMQTSNPLDTWQGASRMRVNHADQIQRQEQAVGVAANAYDSILKEQRQLQQAVASARQAIVAQKRRRNEAVTREQALSDDVDACREEIEQNRPKDGRLNELRSQLEIESSNEQGQKAITEDLARSKGTLDGEQLAIKQRMDLASQKVREHEERLTAARESFNNADDKRNTALREKNSAIESVKDYTNEVEAAKTARDTQDKLLKDDFIDQAEKVSARIPVDPGVTPQMLDARLERFLQDLERAQQNAGGTLEQLTHAHVEAAKKLHDAVSQSNNLKYFVKVATATWSNRTTRWKLFRRYIDMRAQTQFKYLLSERGFRGELHIDHGNKLLDISVEPNILTVSDVGREARTLSGGEKSFATICLLLSIWEAIASPIRCLDEFDVFMDSVNRGESVRMICENARRSVGRQFILITPQSMQNVQEKEDVTIYKMPDPERGQQTLPFV